MATAIALSTSLDSVVRLIPSGMAPLAQLSDEELLASTRRLVGKTNQLLAALLLHLAEVETRGAHRTRCCASLYAYCIYELRFSEDAAARRLAAARFVKQFPALLDAAAAGELHLTGLLMIGPHLTPENHLEVLGRAKFRTKKELAKLVRDLNPLPSLRDRVEPLGSLEKRKFAVGASSGRSADFAEQSRRRGAVADAGCDKPESPRQRGATFSRRTDAAPRPRSRYIPAATRREVYERDGGRCSYVDSRGERCCETRFLELHHLDAFAKGGRHEASNLALRCATHNALAAEADFGKERVAERRDSTTHESLSRQLIDE